jgi:predicted amino acid racemase
MKLFLPRIEISLPQIRGNARILADLYGQKGISVMGVSKAGLGEPYIEPHFIKHKGRLTADCSA